VAHAGRALVAVTTFWVNVAQKGEAVAAWDLMKLAHLLLLTFKQPRAAEAMARVIRQRIVVNNTDDELLGGLAVSQ
jgi:hypothetical protein